MEQSPPPPPPPPPLQGVKPARKPASKVAIVGAIVFLILLVIVGLQDDPKPSKASKTASIAASPALAATVETAPETVAAITDRTIKETTFGCVTTEIFHDVSDYWMHDEKDLMRPFFADGSCEVLAKDAPVIMVDVKFMDYVVVRRHDSTKKLITFRSAI